MKSEKGEVKLEVIITIILLIIFGGICIFMLTGDNGIFVPEKYEIINNNETTVNDTIDKDKLQEPVG